MPENRRAPTTDATFVITRVFDAPLPLIWKAWSEANELKAWWGPKGCSIEVASLEFRPGGFFHYLMRFQQRPEMWGRFLYREIVPQERILWLNSFSNERCGITRAPFDPKIPLEILNHVTFVERGGRTTVTLRASPHGAPDDEVRTFRNMFASLEQGYGGTFDQLAQILAAA